MRLPPHSTTKAEMGFLTLERSLTERRMMWEQVDDEEKMGSEKLNEVAP